MSRGSDSNVTTGRAARLAALACLSLAVALAACHPAGTGKATSPATASAALLLDASDGQDWPGFGRTYGEQHFSPLEAINAQNVGQLGLAWFHDLGRGNSTTGPIEVGGVIYIASRYSFVSAIDAKTGATLWTHDSHAVEKAGQRMRQSWGSRGIAWWNGKVYTGTVDGRLVALDAKTGAEIWSADTLVKGDIRAITGPPRAFDGKIIIGHAGADTGPTRGYVTTYDAETGKQLWRFYTVPGQPGVDDDETTRMAAKSWAGEWWKHGGGGTVWNAMTYDADTDTVFLGTGNGYPWNYRVRSQGRGDNLFLSSIVALDAKTGAYKWHYQTNPGETWDYNADMDMELAELSIDGKARKVLMTAPKNGFFYVLDRVTGKLLSAQPIADKITWASGIDLATGRPVEDPQARFADGTTALVWPGAGGAHSWLPMAYSPATRLVYIPTMEGSNSYSDAGIDLSNWKPPAGNVADGTENLGFDLEHGGPTNYTGYLQAYDPVAQRRVWRVPTPSLTGGGVAASAGGLVFQGQVDGKFNAYSAADGKRLWSFDAGAPILAPPIIYSLAGQQYVTVITGKGTSFATYGTAVPDRFDYRTQPHYVLTFAIGGTAKLPPPAKAEVGPVADPGFRAEASSRERGWGVAGLHCIACHGLDLVADGAAPDLRSSPMVLEPAAFQAVVRDGALLPNGMPRFEELTDQDLADIRQYIRQEASTWRQALRAKRQPAR